MTLAERASELSRCAWRRANCGPRRRWRQQAIGALIKASRRAERLTKPSVPRLESSFEVVDGAVRELPTWPAEVALAHRTALWVVAS